MEQSAAQELPKNYDPKEIEGRLFDFWYKSGFFHRDAGGYANPEAETYTIVIPPPNITGMLHMGHALNDTIQDTCIRRARMRGYRTRWILGTDHAGIATQTKVDKHLAEQGISRREIGREKFLEACWQWREQYGKTIVEQIKGMGCSVDYDDERFTLDPDYADAVRRVFCDWYHAGLIYRGKRIVNWCPHCTTAIADDEAEYVDEKGHLWYLRYPLVEPVDGQEYIVVATTRPETMLGDTGVAVSPKDPDKAKFVGAKVKLPIVGREIPIFSDFYVDAGFGTGFVKVTPSHDPNDWGMGERHGLEKINIFDETAHVVEGYGKFSGMDRDEAREAIVAEFESLGLLDHVEDHDHSVMTCYRCHSKLEPWESEQWFVKVDDLKVDARRVVEDGSVQFFPARWKQVYLDWLDNLKDWCISRQLWWGHRIPMFYCDNCGWEDALMEPVDVCPKCGSPVRQDEDVLDTWFSSQLWPFATMDWGKYGADAPELKDAYPTQVLSTARDIMGLWVARMIMASEYFMHEIPYHHVIIHPTVMGADGKPMSKSRGNGVDPLRLMEDYGADGMRFGLLMQVTGAQDLRFNEARLEGSRNFATKIWNAARFILMNLDGYEPGGPEPVSDADKWILSRLAGLTARLEEAEKTYDFAKQTQEIYEFFWNELCDWYIEFSKGRLRGEGADRLAAQRNLVFILDQALRLLHPMMPFITDEIWQKLPIQKTVPSIMVAEYPSSEKLAKYIDAEAERAIELVRQVVSSARSTRARYQIGNKNPLDLVVKASDEDVEVLEGQRGLIESMANTGSLVMASDAEKPKAASAVITDDLEVFIGLEGLVDFDAERARLTKNRDKLLKDKAKYDKKLSNQGFLSKAAPEIIEKTRNEAADVEDALSRIEAQLAELGE
ncbi:MAG: valine--tRNA ligase [Coriobacteriales bacterium]